MPLESEEEKNNDGTRSIYVFDSESPNDRHLAFLIDPKANRIEFYPKEKFVVPTVELEGFSRVPPEISDLGYFKAGLQYYFAKKFEGKTVARFKISKESSSSLRAYRKGLTLVLNYEAFRDLKKRLTELTNENKLERSQAIDEFFHREFPSKFNPASIPAKRRAKRAIRNLDESIIEHLESDDVEAVLNFVESLLKGRYASAARRRQLFGSAKLKVDEAALRETIETFEKKIEQGDSEHKWGKFLKEHLYLIDSKYVGVIGELNVVLGGQRKVDFGLVDSQGYLDIFEIKKPDTGLLAKQKDRGNYYWHTDVVKAIAQAEKYLFHAERKAANLREDIAREHKIEVEVIRPRAVLICGSTRELDKPEKDQDFRVLRMALKNVDLVPYDELLVRLKNQLSKTY